VSSGEWFGRGVGICEASLGWVGLLGSSLEDSVEKWGTFHTKKHCTVQKKMRL
jgi:hypothetical protein